MTIELKPEDEALIQESLESGDFKTAEEVVHRALAWWARSEGVRVEPAQPGRQSLSEFLMQSPLAGSELNLERDRDSGRDIDL